jgi:5'-methylthioadenosine phosphorylase
VTHPTKLGIIGGSGLYDLPGLENVQWQKIETPWGAPSDDILTGTLHALPIAFLPRHGRGHVHSPTELNARANIAALKMLGCTDILSVSACGSFNENAPPGTFVLVDQFIDRTQSRVRTYFDGGVVAHVSMADPTCNRLASVAKLSATAQNIPHLERGTYVCIEGPQFSTRAESRLYKSWGADVIGMTNLPEAYLAREAELCYLSVAMVTDFDSWISEDSAVNIPELMATLAGNTKKAALLIGDIAAQLAARRPNCEKGCNTALEFAVMTAEDKRTPAKIAQLRAIAERIL